MAYIGKPKRQLTGYKINVRLEGSGLFDSKSPFEAGKKGFELFVDQQFGAGKPKRQLNGYKINARLEGSGFFDSVGDGFKIWADYQFGNGDYYRDRTSMNKKKK
jgi:hypothetical protein